MPDVLETLKKLPRECWTTSPTEPTLVIKIERGVMGYYPGINYPTTEQAERSAASLNTTYGVTPQQLYAMEMGSCFGWEVPAAEPGLREYLFFGWASS